MTMVRFATTCDRCGKRSEEYTAWPSCRICMADTCHACAVDGSLKGGDGERETVICQDCRDAWDEATYSVAREDSHR